MAGNRHIFEKRSIMKGTVEQMMAFHSHPTAFSKLTPPPIFLQVKRDDRTSLTEGELQFVLWFGPIPVRWLARHEPGPTEHSFVDHMLEGPLAYWRHEHIFEPADGGVVLTDRITIEHQPGLKGLLTRLSFDGPALAFLFFYRHMRTRLALR